MTYKRSMLYGMLALGLVQSLSILYGYLFNSLSELGKHTALLSVLAIVIMAMVGVIPGALLHFLKTKLPSVSTLILGFIIFFGLNTLAYVAQAEVEESTTEIIYSSIVYGVCGVFMGYLYTKHSIVKTTNANT